MLGGTAVLTMTPGSLSHLTGGDIEVELSTADANALMLALAKQLGVTVVAGDPVKVLDALVIDQREKGNHTYADGIERAATRLSRTVVQAAPHS